MSPFDQEPKFTLYYRVHAFNMDALSIMESKIIRLHWIFLEDLKKETVTLAVDKKVIELLKIV